MTALAVPITPERRLLKLVPKVWWLLLDMSAVLPSTFGTFVFFDSARLVFTALSDGDASKFEVRTLSGHPWV